MLWPSTYYENIRKAFEVYLKNIHEHSEAMPNQLNAAIPEDMQKSDTTMIQNADLTKTIDPNKQDQWTLTTGYLYPSATNQPS